MSYEDQPSTDRDTLAPDKATSATADLSITAGEASAADLPLAMQRDEDVSDQNPDAVVLANPQWGSFAMLAMAASFDTAVPAAVLAANYAIFRNADLRGEGSTNDGTMTLEAHFREKFEGIDENGKPKNAEDDDSVLDRYMEMAEERAERKREMEEWSRGEHTLGSVTMTGAEWAEFSEELKRDGPMRDWFIDQIMKKENKTKAEAHTEANRIALLAQMQSIPKDRWTAEMKALDRDLDAHPDERRRYEDYIADGKDQRAKGFEAANTLEKTSATTNRATSIEAGADAFNSGEGTPLPNSLAPVGKASNATADFPTAPDLQAHHEAALAATEPLDVQKAAVQVASVSAPTSAPGSGFDV